MLMWNLSAQTRGLPPNGFLLCLPPDNMGIFSYNDNSNINILSEKVTFEKVFFNEITERVLYNLYNNLKQIVN